MTARRVCDLRLLRRALVAAHRRRDPILSPSEQFWDAPDSDCLDASSVPALVEG